MPLRDRTRRLEAARLYRKRRPEVKAAQNRRYREKHREDGRLRDYMREWHEGRREKNKKPRGRRCVSCGATDATCSWSYDENWCAACRRRRQRNGRCESCGAALFAEGCRTCPSELEVRLWDALRWREDEPLTLERLAGFLGVVKRQAERTKDKVLAVVKRHDPGARWERDSTLAGAPAVLRFDSALLRAGLEERALRGGAA